MKHLKQSKQALGAEAIAGLEDFAPPTVFAHASRLHFSTRMYNLLTTNVPGPQFPLYLLGREMLEMMPIAFLAPGQRMAIACMSYNGTVALSVIGDYDGCPISRIWPTSCRRGGRAARRRQTRTQSPPTPLAT